MPKNARVQAEYQRSQKFRELERFLPFKFLCLHALKFKFSRFRRLNSRLNCLGLKLFPSNLNTSLNSPFGLLHFKLRRLNSFSRLFLNSYLWRFLSAFDLKWRLPCRKFKLLLNFCSLLFLNQSLSYPEPALHLNLPYHLNLRLRRPTPLQNRRLLFLYLALLKFSLRLNSSRFPSLNFRSRWLILRNFKPRLVHLNSSLNLFWPS